MKQKYQKWIEENVKETYGKCATVTLEMAEVFPELQRVRGHYHCYGWGKREHWWLVIGEEIVDPTKDQFPSKGNGIYVEFTGPEPTGLCPNCGGLIYDGGYCCSEKCRIEYVAYCQTPIKRLHEPLEDSWDDTGFRMRQLTEYENERFQE